MERANTRVLVVDDKEGIRDLFKVLLEEQGYLCHVASCGDEALEVMSKEPVELAVVDIMMPGMSGLSLYQHIKQVYPHVTVVFVTAVDYLSIAVNHVKDGAHDYVVKPVTSERLCRVVEEALAQRRVAPEEARHRKLLEERASRQAEQLEARVRELSSLSRVYQAELSTNTAPEEDSSLERLQVLSDQRLQRSMLAIQENGPEAHLRIPSRARSAQAPGLAAQAGALPGSGRPRSGRSGRHARRHQGGAT